MGAYYFNPGDGAFTAVDGVNFLEMPCGAEWNPDTITMDDPSSEAILVVRSSCGDSSYNANKGGFFRGILIVDNLDKLHGKVIGAIVGVVQEVVPVTWVMDWAWFAIVVKLSMIR